MYIMSTDFEPMEIVDSSEVVEYISNDYLVYVKVPLSDLLSRAEECRHVAPYSNYPASCTDRSFRILGLITDRTFQASISERVPRSHTDIKGAMSNICSNPIDNVVKPITEIFDELPIPNHGELSACAMYLLHKNVMPGSLASGHTVIASKNESGVISISDTSIGQEIIGTNPIELTNRIDQAGYKSDNVYVTVYKKISPTDELNITPIGGRKTRKTKKLNKWKKTKRKNNKK